MAGKEFDVKYKVLLIGNSGVGKTALIRALTQEEFSMEMLPTIGIDFVKKIFHVDGANVQLEIWDTAGQERFRTITKFQYRGTKEIRPDHPTESIPVYIIGNKCDLEQQRQISKRDGKKKAQETLVRGFMETSAKNNINIQEAFYELAHALLDTYNPKLMTSYLNPVDRKEKKGSKQRISQLTSSSSEYDQTSSRSKKIKLKKKDKPRSSCCHRS
ncbi:ras-related protein Rab-13 isoform X2 [Lingula anatina]|uniref:Ras-related protein Rab-13 isoform X2 n=1 Tax=Lingula anatina TaxID=7574 RepID=A0A1S3I473_LINAN|nr:ras-related protein Rab-13 isoform X2 [Lingula anatina]|eukprot:XP_013393065.1 ras-related protein Rab-13 isoform X2 [Lingula anatina]